MIFFVAAAMLVFTQMVRGWRLGVVRQLINLLALIVAYPVAIFAGRLAAPLFRPLGYPDILISLVVGSLLALIVYACIASAGAILFRRTNQQDIGLIRLGYGAGGSFIGMIFGFITVWLAVLGIRVLGTVAETEMQVASHPVAGSRDTTVHIRPSPFASRLARMKESLEHGATGAVMERVDPLPHSAYSVVAKLSRVAASPESMSRFMDYPGTKPLSQHPRILALQNDPLIVRQIEERNYLALLKNENIVAAANDPEVTALVKRFDLEKALDYALSANEKSNSSSAATHLQRWSRD